MSSRQLDEERIFHVARGLADSDLRTDHLDQICAGDQALRERVEALLEVHEKEEEFLKSSPEPAPTVDHPPLSEGPGHQIGRYKLLQKIGEGGFGVVYMAEQVRPVRRKVALKIIKPGMDTHAVVARFEAERQALALMDHVNISRVLDGGTTESGRPYFVMELVKGAPITEYCDKNRLSTHDRLKLFVTVCQAVQHAHQKGIIHRDLKPSNILVTLADGMPVVKVIDFGVSKALNQQLTEKTLFTAYGQMIGTPQYMSPEQAEMSCLDVDTRSDIYSLGVLLYELLTGTTPLAGERLRTIGYAAMQRIIREEEPPKPSTRLSTAGEDITTIAMCRGVSPERLRRTVRGDLDWIVMKALEKDRIRRYETASLFGRDVQRFLESEPIEARRPTTFYRLRVFAKRNTAGVLTATFIAAALITGTAIAFLGWSDTVMIQHELQDKNDQLLDLMFRDAFEDAMSGNDLLASEAITRLDSAGAPQAWLTILEGQRALYTGETERAFRLLRSAKEMGGESILPQALLSVALALGGHPVEFEQELADLEQLAAKRQLSDFERLFLGQARFYRNTNEGLSTLEDLPARGRWPLVDAIVADCLTHHAIENSNPSEVKRALQMVDDARGYLPENAYAVMVDLFAHTIALRLIEESDPIHERLVTEGYDLADKLKEFPRFPVGIGVRCMFFLRRNDLENARSAAKEATVRAGHLDYTLASILYRQGEYGEAKKLLPENPDEKNTWRLFGRAEMIAFEADAEQATRHHPRS